ncbi:unnamed protein product [Staurois parvus]|uniref:Uncharacterized protein n=1 Tax=Staurois parvus TaxID=386267 RepID=A0ABN9BRB3_9NEOB|nr:unnamed protein product [Staurois parvus]
MVEFCTNQNAHRSFLHLSLVRYTAWKNGDPTPSWWWKVIQQVRAITI